MSKSKIYDKNYIFKGKIKNKINENNTNILENKLEIQ